MKLTLKQIAVILMVGVLFSSCTEDQVEMITDDSETIEVDSTSRDLKGGRPSSFGHISMDDYELVIVDQDNWEIFLNTKRIRTHVTSYHGDLTYMIGTKFIQGKASAVFDKRTNVITIVAESNFPGDEDIIVYTFTFGSDGKPDVGNYCFLNSPRQVAGIGFYVDKGQVGGELAEGIASSDQKKEKNAQQESGNDIKVGNPKS